MICGRWQRYSQQVGWLLILIALLVILHYVRQIKGQNWELYQNLESKLLAGCSSGRKDDKGTGGECAVRKPTVWIKGRGMESGYLDHVITVFERLGYARVKGGTDWDVLWAHDYPFLDKELKSALKRLKPHQRVNHVPGSGYYTSKVNLAVSNITGIPRAFSLPKEKDQFVQFAATNKDLMWVQKSNLHRGIKIVPTQQLDLSKEGSFIQQYISNPLLIDGKKFDIGIYVAITSTKPLRAYYYSGEALLRFCSVAYEPFDPGTVDKYVVGDDYTPTWDMPSLGKMYTDMAYTHKETLSAYLRGQGKDPTRIWSQIEAIIRDVLLSKQESMTGLLSSYHNEGLNFFELSRFDFVLDSDLNAFLMEANMSPNLSSGHFPPNALLYEQVIFNIFSVVGIARSIHTDSLATVSTAEHSMRVGEKDIQTNSDLCTKCEGCADWKCKACHRCLTPELRVTLEHAYLEHINRRNMRRIVPPTMDQNHLILNAQEFDASVAKLRTEDRILRWWFAGKCKQDATWCS